MPRLLGDPRARRSARVSPWQEVLARTPISPLAHTAISPFNMGPWSHWLGSVLPALPEAAQKSMESTAQLLLRSRTDRVICIGSLCSGINLFGAVFRHFLEALSLSEGPIEVVNAMAVENKPSAQNFMKMCPFFLCFQMLCARSDCRPERVVG